MSTLFVVFVLSQALSTESLSYSPFKTRQSRIVLNGASSFFVTVNSVTSQTELEVVSDFFVKTFFLKPGDSKLRTPGLNELERDQLNDWVDMFGQSRKTEKSTLLVAKEFGKIVGTCSITASPYANLGASGETFDPRNRAAFPTRDKQAIVPILSNLAVARDARGRGIGEKLVKACEERAQRWGYNEVRLLLAS